MKSAFRITILPCVLAIAGSGLCAYGETVGFNETGGRYVAAETESLAGGLKLSPDATFLKSGSGTLEVPMSDVDTATPWSAVVTGGKLSLTGVTAPRTAAAQAPDVFNRAAFWVDSSGLPDGEVSTWQDCRGGEGRYSAEVRYRNAPSQTPPVVKTGNGCRGLYFGGSSGKWMRFRLNGADATIADVRHFFVVHGVADCWTPVLGSVNTDYPRGYGMLTTLAGAGGLVNYADLTYSFYPRGDMDFRHFGARWFLDGVRFDPYSQIPRKGPQLLEADMLSMPTSYDAFMYSYCETMSAGTDRPGGDYLCEVVLFTNKLSEVERIDVERHLMAKWSLPNWAAWDSYGVSCSTPGLPPGTGTVRVGADATAEVDVSTGGESVPLAFRGAGSVVKKGAGTLVLGGSDGTPFAGTFSLTAGDALLRGGGLPPVTMGAAETWDASAYPAEFQQKLNQVATGVKVVKGAAEQGLAVKSGRHEVRVGSVGAAVRTLQVSAGTLTLSSREMDLQSLDAGLGELDVAVPNASFELPFPVQDNNRGFNFGSSSTKAFNGWYEIAGDGKGYQLMTTGYPGFGAWTSYLVPAGTNALLLIGRAQVETDVTLPRVGEYEVSFWAANRYGVTHKGDLTQGKQYNKECQSPVEVQFAGRMIGRVQTAHDDFVKYTFRFTADAADVGVIKRLGLKVLRKPTDIGVLVDDVRIKALAVGARTDVVKVPGGDFEMGDIVSPTTSSASEYFFSRNVVPDGWTLDLSAGASLTEPVNGYIAVTTPTMPLYHGSKPYFTTFYPLADGLPGAAALGFFGTYGIATSGTFKLPKGRWLLRAKLAYWPVNVFAAKGATETDFSYGNMSLSAKISGGLSLDLGRVGSSVHSLKTVVWPTVVDVAEDVDIAIALQSGNNCGGVVDDLEFVPAVAALPEMELVQNGGFEKRGDGWSAFVYNNGTTYKSCSPSVSWPYAQEYQNAFGYAAFEGDTCLRLHNSSGGRCSVKFPAPGLYRLTFHARTRADEYGYAKWNPIRVYELTTDFKTTNVIATVDMPWAQNFVEVSRLFRVTTAGEKYLCIVGLGVPSGVLDAGKDTADRTTFVDGVSIRKVDEALQLKPVMSADVRVEVSNGAKLALDYVGTNVVQGVKLGGVRQRGVVDATTCPDFVTGTGALEIVPPGMCVIFR